MIDITKHMEFFNPINDLNKPIHVIGLGAIGSTIVEMLARLGVEELNIYDFDTVSQHNIANQNFFYSDIGDTKINAVIKNLQNINPEINITAFEKGYTGQALSGYVFLAVDNIDLRREIATNNKLNPMITAMFDFRMGLTDAQHYAAKWNDEKMKTDFINSMQFTHEEAKAATPISACGRSMNVIPTVRTIVSLGIANFINLVKTQELKKLILIDAFHFIVDTF